MIDKWLLEDAALLELDHALEHDSLIGVEPQYAVQFRCPICADTYQHVTSSWQHIPGRDNYEAGWGGRGDLVMLPLWGECGHRWELCLGTHKGETFVFIRVPCQDQAEPEAAA